MFQRAAFLSVLGLALLSGLVALEPGIRWESFGRDQGLSSSAITGILQDPRGFLWFATQSGLDRWDGYSMKIWQKEPFSENTLSHNIIQTLYLDGERNLWLGTYGGLDLFDLKTEKIRTFRHSDSQENSLSSEVVTRIYRDHRGALWIATLDGLNRMDESTGTFRVYRDQGPNASGLSGKTVRTMVEDSTGDLWIGSNGGIDRYDPRSDRLIPYAQLFPGRQLPPGTVMAALHRKAEPYLWLAIWGSGLVRFNPSTGETKTFAMPDSRLFGVDDGSDGQLLLSTWGGGLVVFDIGRETSFALHHDASNPSSLAHDVVYGTYRDRSGLLWVATNGGGISRYNPRHHQFQSLEFPSRVIALAQSKDGSLWVSSYNQGLARVLPDGTRQTWSHHGPSDRSLSNDLINSLTVAPDGKVWAMTNEGASIVDPDTGKVRRWATHPGSGDTLPDEILNSLLIDRAGRYWFGTYREGLVRRSGPGSDALSHRYRAEPGVAGSLPDNMVYFVEQDREGRIWVGTNGGLALYQPATDDFRVWTYNEKNREGIPGNTVRCLFQDSRGRIWVGTNGGGLSRLNLVTGRFDNLTLGDGLTTLSVYSVEEDSAGVLWIATTNGLFSYLPDSRTFRRYGTPEGLDSSEFSAGHLTLTDGNLAFGSVVGVTIVRSNVPETAEPPPQIALTGIQVLSKDRPVTTDLGLNWQENTLTIAFSVLDFRLPDKNLYAYRLDGFDRSWVVAGTRHEATYTNLTPGTYRFWVRGANPAGIWSSPQMAMIIRVEAAPWNSWYAWLIYLAALIVVIYLIQRARVSHFLAQKVSELESLREQLESANARLDLLTRLDPLTGIPNRRALDNHLDEEWARALRHRTPMAVLMIDIDDFKRFNDYYGHPAGDTCLRTVASTLKDQLHRTSDLCGRYGGEEFAVVLHDTGLEGALIVAKRMSLAVDALVIPHEVATATRYVTLSIGVCCLVPSQDGTVAELIRDADKALYRAKALGRHRIEVEPGL